MYLLKSEVFEIFTFIGGLKSRDVTHSHIWVTGVRKS